MNFYPFSPLKEIKEKDKKKEGREDGREGRKEGKEEGKDKTFFIFKCFTKFLNFFRSS